MLFCSFIMSQAQAASAQIISPINGSTLTSTSVTFYWGNVGASEYFLYVGTTQGGNNLYGRSLGTSTSATVAGLPSNGSRIYARIWSRFNNSWSYYDYSYTAKLLLPAKITSPANGSSFTSTSVSFRWENVGASQYWLTLGTTQGGKDLYDKGQGINTSITVSGLPNNGRRVYARIFSVINSNWQYNDYSYIAYQNATPKSVGDVVGRDLQAWEIVNWLGHVGMWTGSSVIEVLNKTPVIQQNSLPSFRTATNNFWGTRYGKGSNYYTMISKGWDQSNYSPSYTTTAQWREGKKEYKCTKYNLNGTCATYGYVTTTAVFRCDTFVNFMYLKGTGSNLVTLFTPLNVYNTMPYSR